MPMRIGTEVPSLAHATEWINGSAIEAEALMQGHPTLVHFWAVSCNFCKQNMPRVAEWRERYRDEGLRVIAIHMPRYPADTDIDRVRETIESYKITEPCAIDNEHKLRDEFQNEHGYVPAYYLFDGHGKLRSYAAGERGLGMLSAALDRTLHGKKQPA